MNGPGSAEDLLDLEELARGPAATTYRARYREMWTGGHDHYCSVVAKVIDEKRLTTVPLGDAWRQAARTDTSHVAELDTHASQPVMCGGDQPDAGTPMRAFTCVAPFDDYQSLQATLNPGERPASWRKLVAVNSVPLSVPRALRIATNVASALASAHTTGRLHGNLKPSNVLVALRTDPVPEAKVCDFGAHHLLDAGGTIGHACESLVPYMSPEQCRTGLPQDERSDIYALGCLLRRMVGGHPPVRSTLAEMLHAQEHLSLFPIPAGLPANLDLALRHMLAKEPGARPSSMTDVESMLLGVLGEINRGSGAATWRPPLRYRIRKSFDSKAGSTRVGDFALAEPLISQDHETDFIDSHPLGQSYVAAHADDAFPAQVIVLDPQAGRSGARTKLLKTALAASELGHPSIQRVYAARHQGGIHYLAAEPVSPHPWDATPSVWATAWLELARALEALRQAGLVHGAIATHSIGFVTRPATGNHQTAVLCNVGAGAVIGLQDPYGPISPEHFHGRSIDHRTDIYCLGYAVFYKLTGVATYTGSIMKQKFRKPRRPGWKADVSADFDVVMRRVLQEDPAERYQTAGELAAALAELPELSRN